MAITVIIPTLNEEQALPQTLAGLTSTSELEIVIVDGGSTDQTVPIAETFCTTVPIAKLLTAPVGRARQLNEGAKASQGDVFIFLHADTRLPTNVQAVIASALADPTVVGGRFDVYFDSPSPWGRIIGTLMNWRSRLSRIATGDQAIFVRRHIFEQLSGFAEIPLMEDIEFSRRLKRIGPIAAVREPVVTSFRRWEKQGPLKTILLMWTLRFLYWVGVSPSRLSRWYEAVR